MRSSSRFATAMWDDIATFVEKPDGRAKRDFVDISVRYLEKVNQEHEEVVAAEAKDFERVARAAEALLAALSDWGALKHAEERSKPRRVGWDALSMDDRFLHLITEMRSNRNRARELNIIDIQIELLANLDVPALQLGPQYRTEISYIDGKSSAKDVVNWPVIRSPLLTLESLASLVNAVFSKRAKAIADKRRGKSRKAMSARDWLIMELAQWWQAAGGPGRPDSMNKGFRALLKRFNTGLPSKEYRFSTTDATLRQALRSLAGRRKTSPATERDD